MKQKELQDKLEELVDQTSLQDVLDNLVLVCDAKAEHLRCNWQDELTAMVWDKRGQLMARAATDLR